MFVGLGRCRAVAVDDDAHRRAPRLAGFSLGIDAQRVVIESPSRRLDRCRPAAGRSGEQKPAGGRRCDDGLDGFELSAHVTNGEDRPLVTGRVHPQCAREWRNERADRQLLAQPGRDDRARALEGGDRIGRPRCAERPHQPVAARPEPDAADELGSEVGVDTPSREGPHVLDEEPGDVGRFDRATGVGDQGRPTTGHAQAVGGQGARHRSSSGPQPLTAPDRPWRK